MTANPSIKACSHCKTELDPKVDYYTEFRYSYENEEEDNVTNIGLVYVCDNCIDKVYEYEEDEFDEH